MVCFSHIRWEKVIKMSTQALSAISTLQKFIIEPHKGLTSQRGYFDWIFDFLGFIGSFVVSSPKKSLSESVESLPSSAMEDVFGKYVAKMSAEVRELEAVDLTNDHDRKGCIKRLFALGIMETHAQKWMQGHTKKYDYSDVTDLFKRANAIRQNILKQRPKGKTYTVSASLKERSVSALSKTSPGIYNGGNNCYLISLFQGILGDPITRRWIVDGTFLVDSPRVDNDVKPHLKRFVTALKKCAFEYEEAQRTSQKKELKFILELREAIDPLITTLTLSSGKQEDPSEVLVQLLQYISPEGNPLFNELTEFSVFKLEQGQAEILDRAQEDLEKAKATLEVLSKSIAAEAETPEDVFKGLKGFLQSIDSKGDYVGLNDTLGVLKAILIVFKGVTQEEAKKRIEKAQSVVKRSSYPSKSGYQNRLKQIANEVTLKMRENQAQMEKIQEATSLPALLYQVSEEINQRLKAPKLHGE